MDNPTFIENFKVVERLFENMDNSLNELTEIARLFLIAHEVEKMFYRDAKKIKDIYDKGEIQRKEASEALKELDDLAEKIGDYVSRLRDMLTRLKDMTDYKLKELIRSPKEGVPFTETISNIKGRIKEIRSDLRKKTFGIMKIEEIIDDDKGKEIILDFLDEYEGGVIVLPEKLRGLIDNISIESKLLFEINGEILGNLICVFEYRL